MEDKRTIPLTETKKSHLSQFRASFIDHLTNRFIESLKELHGEISSKEGKNEKRSRNVMDLLYTGLAAVPVIGPALQLIPQGVQKAEHRIAKGVRRRALGKLELMLAEINKGEITGEIETLLKFYLEDTAFELSRIFEYQITSRSNKHHVQIMAEDASERCFNYLKEHPEISLNQSSLIQGVLKGHSKGEKVLKVGKELMKKEAGKRIDSEELNEKEAWYTPSVFKKPGLVHWEFPEIRQYYHHAKRPAEGAKYKFREMSIVWSGGDTGCYEAEDITKVKDKDRPIWSSIDQDNVPQDFLDYKPYYIRVTAQDLDIYLTEVKKQYRLKKPIPVFNEFICKRYLGDVSIQEVSAVLWQLPQGIKDFSYGDFSNTVWIHLDLSEHNLSHCNFNNTSLMYANLNQTKLIATTFKGADLRFSDLSDIRESKDANFMEAKLYHADLSNSQFADNVNFTFAEMKSVDITKTDLSGADLTEAKLDGSNLCETAALPPNLNKQIKNITEVLKNYDTKLDELKAMIQSNKSSYFDIENIAFASGMDASKFGGKVQQELIKEEITYASSYSPMEHAQATSAKFMGAIAALNTLDKRVRTVAFEAGSIPPTKEAGGTISQGLMSITIKETSQPHQPSQSPAEYSPAKLAEQFGIHSVKKQQPAKPQAQDEAEETKTMDQQLGNRK